MVFIMPHMDIELEDNKQFFSKIPHIFETEVGNLFTESKMNG